MSLLLLGWMGCIDSHDLTVPAWRPTLHDCPSLVDGDWPTMGLDGYAQRETWKNAENSLSLECVPEDIDPARAVYEQEDLPDSRYYHPDIGWGHAWTVTTSETGTLRVDTFGSEVDTFLGIAWIPDPSEPLDVQCECDPDGLEISLEGEDTDFHIAVGGAFRAQGMYRLNVRWDE